ncbi:MAG: ATP-binding protein [Burkholderiaceae bacterium]
MPGTSPHSTIANFLRARQPMILRSGEARVGAEAREIELVGLALRDEVPELLDELAVWLQSGAPPDASLLAACAQTHVLQRLESGFALAQVFREYRLLRETIIEHVLDAETSEQQRTGASGDGERLGRIQELARLNAGLDVVISQSVEQFVAARDTRADAERQRIGRAMQQSESRYRSLFESIDEAFCVIEVIFEDGRAVDYRFLETNPSFERHTGIVGGVGRRMREIAPDHEEHWFEVYGKIAATGEPVRFQQIAKALGRFYDVYAFRVGAPANRQVAILFTDITARMRAEKALRESEERYRALFENSEQGLVVVEPLFDADNRVHDLRYLSINAAFETQTGLRAADFLGRRLTEALPGVEAAWLEAFDRVAHSGLPERVEHFNANTGRWYETVIFPHPNGLLAESFVDVTRRRQAALELRANEQRQTFLLELGDALRPLADPLEVQSCAVRVLGQHLGADRVHYGEVLDDQNTNLVHAAYSRVATRASLRGTHRLDDYGEYIAKRFRAGETIVVDDFAHLAELSEAQRAACAAAEIACWVGVPLVRDGRLRAYLAVTDVAPRDWTAAEVGIVQATAERTWAEVERARAEDELRRAEWQLREELAERKRAQEVLQTADQQKDQFLAMLAHELRNPLAPIRNAAAILARALPDKASLQRPLAMIARQTTQLTRLVDDLLDVSRIAGNRIVLKPEVLEIGTVLDQAAESVGPLVEEKQLGLRIVRPQEKVYVRGDQARLVQALANLMHNAAKYTDMAGRIVVTVSASDEKVELEVSDTGAGISAQLLPRVFDLFVQAERTLDRAQGGLGIGLSVTKRLVEMHGGTVRARSAGEGHGSAFTICLPRASAPPPPHAPRPARAPVTPRRILVVDDNADAADSLATLLRMEGHQVETAYGALAGLAAIETGRPEIVFLDIGMPDMDGYEVARRVRAAYADAAKRPRLVALTGYGSAADRADAAAAGFDMHLAKPADPEKLSQLLASIDPG